jgi:diacylglycerol kinase family enzyme
VVPLVPVSGRRRLAAAVALLAAVVVVAVVLSQVGDRFPRGLLVLAATALALAASGYAILHRRAARVAGFVVGGLALLVAAALLFTGGNLIPLAVVVAGTVVAHVAALAAYRMHTRLPTAAAPRSPVLFVNPRSGGGRAARVGLAAEAERRGIRVVELRPGDDLAVLARDAVADGADALAMAGGDGSQAIVAATAAEHGLPYACIPSGTRNHFALDLGVDRDDVVGALDAFVDGGERLVDLADLNGQVFVNNVSLGVYASAVQRKEYRGAKVRTLLDAAPEALTPPDGAVNLQWTGPDGAGPGQAATILVSNNPYRLGRLAGSGTRPRLDSGRLGVAVLGAPGGQRLWQTWASREFRVDADGPVPVGVDGEAMQIEPPLCFSVRPQVLRVRVAPQHPGASPAARMPSGPVAAVKTLLGLVAGRGGSPP